MSKKTSKQLSQEDEIYFEIESEIPEDTHGLMFEGRRFETHGGNRTFLDDDGR